MKRKPCITVITLGPGDPSLLTLQCAEALKKAERLVLRTARHPVASWLTDQGIPFEALDSFYEQYDDFDELYRAMADWLRKESAAGPVSFGVQDPAADRAVAALKSALPKNAELRILPGVSASAHFISLLPPSVSADSGLQAFSTADFLSQPPVPSVPLLITELDSALLAGQVKLRLGELYPDDWEVCLFPPSGDGTGSPLLIPLYQLDTRKRYDHTCAVFVPAADLYHRTRYTFQDLEQIVSRLCAPDGCPWDRVQTHESLRPYMVEEAWEAVNAIEDGDMEHLADELGDVLYQVFIHASLGERFDEFTLIDVVSGICQKMLHRHPHIFGRDGSEPASQIPEGWEKLKREETGSKTVGDTLNDVAQSLPALKYSIKMHRKLSQLPALRRDSEDIAAEIRSLAEKLLRDGRFSPESMTRLLMKCTELCLREDQDAEILLHHGVEKQKHRYQEAEKRIYLDEKTPESLTFQQLCVYLKSVGEETE